MYIFISGIKAIEQHTDTLIAILGEVWWVVLFNFEGQLSIRIDNVVIVFLHGFAICWL